MSQKAEHQEALRPGDTIGILGGGQLGRMLALAAARLGLKCHIYAPEGDNPAFDVAAAHTVGDYRDEGRLAAFADAVALMTYEFENIPAETAALLAARLLVMPGPRALELTQDRLVEKDFLNSINIPTAPYQAVDDAGALARAVAALGRPSILKTRRMGYDGKGQAMIRGGADIGAIFRGLGGGPCILEGVVPFAREISVVAARGRDGGFAAFDICENSHEHHILSRTIVPAHVLPQTTQAAIDMTRRIMDALDYVGTIAVEMFVVEEGDLAGRTERLVVNEIAPRVHNSGHWTLDGAVTSQFEQHIRAIAGWPLGSTRRHGRIVMDNLIGDAVNDVAALLSREGAALHLYGKKESRPGRKMGHITMVTPEE